MPHTKNQHLEWAQPLIQEWFHKTLGTPTEPQIAGWPEIRAGKTTLISAPTGSGKTLAAFLVCIDDLVRKALNDNLEDKTAVLYVSPLKALSNDVQKNLMQPLAAITDLARQRGIELPEIRVMVRSGDTPSNERQKMLKKPPHILVTTPESFYLLLTAEKSRKILADIKTVIVDEIHALANNKRGSHLALSLERLEQITAKPPIRIGLSATQKPIERVAHFLTGNHRPLPTVINIGHRKNMELTVEVPRSELGPIASHEMWDEIYDRISELAQQHRSTLVFVNTRRLAERLAHHLAERLGENAVAAHHGSLSRKLRLQAETQLKEGALKVLVATASLELGIDIGHVDLVCQIGSPRAIAIALQRVGRSGHWHGAISKGRFFVTTRDELIECAALIHGIHQGELDELIIPDQPLDILSQQIIATVATQDWHEDELFKLVTQAYPYQHLSRDTFNTILEMLAQGIAGSRGRYGAYLFRDQIHGMIKARRGSRLSAITSGGAIPDTGLFTVIVEPQGMMVGTLDEDFAVESNRGDIILLGSTSWKIIRVENASGRVLVEDAHGAPPSVPFWRGEAPARTKELSQQVSMLRQTINDFLPQNSPQFRDCENPQQQFVMPLNWLKNNCGVNDSGAEQIIDYLLQGRAVLGAVPTQQRIIAERFFDEGGGMQLIIHAPFGARINKAWGLALRKRFCRSFNFELQAAATDDGLNIALAEQHSFPLADVFHFLHPNTIKEVLIQAVLQSPLFKTRWRWDATRALALLRFRRGKKVPPHIQRMLSDDLLAAVFPDAAACQDNLGGRDIELPDHPLINETIKDSLTEALDLEGFTTILQKILNHSIQCIAVDTPLASAFSHEILNANPYAFLDDAPLEERRARAVEMRRLLPESVLENLGALNPQAIKEVQMQAWPDLRNADELHDTLQTLVVFPVQYHFGEEHPVPPSWQDFFVELNNAGRAGMAMIQHQPFWFAAEKMQQMMTIYPEAIMTKSVAEVKTKISAPESILEEMVRGWVLHLGPTTNRELQQLLLLTAAQIEQILLKLEVTGLILRGHFRNRADQELEWCERRLLARIHRLTLGNLRREIKPISAAQFMQWLLKWQHVAPNTQLKGEQGLLEIIKQLQGFEIPANAWESQILAKRLRDYDRDLLDRLCLSGVIGWGRISSHPSIEHAQEHQEQRRITATSIVPITFFVREECDWMSRQRIADDDELIYLSHSAKSIYQYLKQRGASFFVDIVKGTGKLKSEVTAGLWELVAAGMITADGFDNLRRLIDPNRRLNKRRYHLRGPRFETGRWSLLYRDEPIDGAKNLEAICWMLLKRYGVVFRDLLGREKNIGRWRELLITLRRLEDRGEIRGGRFVDGFLGEQFALPYAIESLRAMKKQPPMDTAITLAAVDPLNLLGIILPGNRLPALSGKTVVLMNEQNE